MMAALNGLPEPSAQRSGCTYRSPQRCGAPDQADRVPNGGEHTDGQGDHHDHRFDFVGRNGAVTISVPPNAITKLFV